MGISRRCLHSLFWLQPPNWRTLDLLAAVVEGVDGQGIGQWRTWQLVPTKPVGDSAEGCLSAKDSR
jgi:hypothetical protein